MGFRREGGEFRRGHVQTDGGSVEPSSWQLVCGARSGLSASLPLEDQEHEPGFLKTTLLGDSEHSWLS